MLLSNRANGPVAVHPPSGKSPGLIPQTQHYLVYINIDDPDGIVTACRYFSLDEAIEALEATWVPTRQPLLGWLDERWQAPRQFSYSVEGDRSTGLIVELLSQT